MRQKLRDVWQKRPSFLTKKPAPAYRAGKRADHFSVQDLVVEASYGIGARPARLVMTTAGTVLGIASLVVTIGFAQTAAGQIARQFDAVAATQVIIEPVVTPELVQVDSLDDSERGDSGFGSTGK